MTEKSIYLEYNNPAFFNPSRKLPRAVAIIGAGTIGPDIGYYLKSALPGIKLYLIDISQTSLANAETRLKAYAEKGVKRKKMSVEKATKVVENIFYTDDYSQIKDCDLIIEAATEDIPLKQKIFAQIEDIVSDSAIITSNTSSIPADRIFAQSQASRTHDGHPLFRPGLAKHRRGNHQLGEGLHGHPGISVLAVRHHGQGADPHGQRDLLHARPNL